MGVLALLKCGAVESVEASSEGVNVPLRRIPLAWASGCGYWLEEVCFNGRGRERVHLPGRKPGCSPNIAWNWANRSLAVFMRTSSVGKGIVNLWICDEIDKALMPPTGTSK